MADESSNRFWIYHSSGTTLGCFFNNRINLVMIHIHIWGYIVGHVLGGMLISGSREMCVGMISAQCYDNVGNVLGINF